MCRRARFAADGVSWSHSVRGSGLERVLEGAGLPGEVSRLLSDARRSVSELPHVGQPEEVTLNTNEVELPQVRRHPLEDPVLERKCERVRALHQVSEDARQDSLRANEQVNATRIEIAELEALVEKTTRERHGYRNRPGAAEELARHLKPLELRIARARREHLHARERYESAHSDYLETKPLVDACLAHLISEYGLEKDEVL